MANKFEVIATYKGYDLGEMTELIISDGENKITLDENKVKELQEVLKGKRIEIHFMKKDDYQAYKLIRCTGERKTLISKN